MDHSARATFVGDHVSLAEVEGGELHVVGTRVGREKGRRV
jgi:hypothetical protein